MSSVPVINKRHLSLPHMRSVVFCCFPRSPLNAFSLARPYPWAWARDAHLLVTTFPNGLLVRFLLDETGHGDKLDNKGVCGRDLGAVLRERDNFSCEERKQDSQRRQRDKSNSGCSLASSRGIPCGFLVLV